MDKSLFSRVGTRLKGSTVVTYFVNRLTGEMVHIRGKV